MISSVIDHHFLRRGSGIEFEMEVEWLRCHIPPGSGPIADVGCGIGALFDVLGPHRVVGVDYQPTGLTLTRDRHPRASLVCGDAQRLPFAEAALDALTSQHVLEHLPAFTVACNEWYRVLQPGGTLLLLTPNRSFRDPSVYEDNTHVHIFNHTDLQQTVQDAGFTIVDVRALGLPWFRNYQGRTGVWRLRRFVTQRAMALSRMPLCRWRGQSLCCVATKPHTS